MTTDTLKFDLRHLCSAVTRTVKYIDKIYFFGSRRHGTRSLRSDIDLLLIPATGAHLKPSDLRDAAMALCPALDLFVVEGGKAVSCMNDSFIGAADLEGLVKLLQAVLIWDGIPVKDAIPTWEVQLHAGVSLIPTNLPNRYFVAESAAVLFRNTEAVGLPSMPYLGSNVNEVGDFLIKVVRRLVRTPQELAGRGKAKGEWSVKLRDEYDFQDLFFHVVKPWLPELARELVQIIFDKNKKLADFSLFNNRVVFEMKHIDDNIKMISVSNILRGLSGFYAQNANIRLLICCILVDVDPD